MQCSWHQWCPLVNDNAIAKATFCRKTKLPLFRIDSGSNHQACLRKKIAFNKWIPGLFFFFDSVESWKNSGEKCLYVACIFVIISFLTALDVLGSFLVSRLQEVRRIFKCQRSLSLPMTSTTKFHWYVQSNLRIWSVNHYGSMFFVMTTWYSNHDDVSRLEWTRLMDTY